MNSLVFKSTAYVGGLLVICFLALLAYTATSTRSQNNTAFATTASTITDYLTGQINTGTRLKRGAMIMPQIEAALSNASMDVVALRVIHTDGTEVIAEQHADITGDLFASLPPADFNSPMTTTIQGSYLIVRTPVTLGTGADQTTVGELVAIWDMQPSLEASTRQVIWTGAAFGLALLIALSGLIILLRMTVRKPLAQTIRAMSQISQEKTNVDYPDTTSSEMAAVASSLEQFQAAAIAKKQAEEAAEKAQADRLEAEAEKARQEELARAAEEATKTKELEDQHQRVAIAQKFQKQLQDVLGKASRGNFNARMADEQADEQLQTLASLINTLLQSIDANIDDVGDKLKALATGNLTVQIDGLREGSYATMQADFNQAVQELASTLQQIRVGSSSVASTASELENGSVMMSKRGEQNAAALEETSAAIEEIAASIKQVVDSTKAANEATKSVQRKATESREVADETENSIKALTTASEKINSVVKVIEDIAFQINLLALNAGVEAARAGEAGRGFSVVASEVRALAQRSQEAVQEIGSVIDENNRTVQEGVRQVARSRETLEIIAQEVDVASSQISNIALAVEEQSSGIEEIRTTIVAIDNSAQENAANLEELTASNVLLSQEANSLNTAVSKFNIEGLDPLENRTSHGSARRRTYG